MTSHDLSASAPLNPAQQEIRDLLGAPKAERPSFDPNLRSQLRAALEEALRPIVAELPEDQRSLWVSKHRLSQLDGCEVRARAEAAQPFEWSVALARGTVAHKAIELSIHWKHEPVPLELVDQALARLEHGEDGLAKWLQGIDEVEQAELRAEAAERVTAFVETWPPLNPKWRPTTEARMRAELADGTVILAGKVDLALGHAHGQTAGKVLVDLKTGASQRHHLDDLRFYALVDTLKVGVPPRRLATYYLDQGRPIIEDVTVDMLDWTIARVVNGVDRMVALELDPDSAIIRTGPPCAWCPVRSTCVPGQAWLREFRDLDDDPRYDDDE